MSVRTLLILYDEVSILRGAERLFEDGEYLLFLVVVVFTVIFPAVKLLLAYLVWTRFHVDDPRLASALGRIETLGKWSMLDVFVVALVVVIITVSLVSDVAVHPGLYVFTAAVLLSMVAVRRIAMLARRAGRPGSR